MSMQRTVFNETANSIYAGSTKPQLLYLRREGNDVIKPAHTLQSQEETAELIVIENGSGCCIINDQLYEIEKGDLILLNAGALHGLGPEEARDLEVCRLGIRQLHLKGLSAGQLISESASPIFPLGMLFTSMQHYLALFDALQKNPKKHLLAEAQNTLLSSLLSAVMQLINSDGHTELPAQEYSLGLHIKEYIDAHYLEDMRLGDIANALHINPYYLSHTFKKVVGYSPIQYMIRRRIGESQNLLVNTNYTITEIALRCGYNNSNYFQAVFNSIVGMPPGRYRKTWRQ